VLAPGSGKTKTGRLWTYVRDDRPAGEDTAPAVWFAYSEDRKGEQTFRKVRRLRANGDLASCRLVGRQEGAPSLSFPPKEYLPAL